MTRNQLFQFIVLLLFNPIQLVWCMKYGFSQPNQKLDHDFQNKDKPLAPSLHCSVRKFNKVKKPLSMQEFKRKFQGCMTRLDDEDIKENKLNEIYQLSYLTIEKFSAPQKWYHHITDHFRKIKLKKDYSVHHTFAKQFQTGDALLFRYELLHLIGKGSFALVALAKDHKYNRNVALKIAFSDSNDPALDQKEANTQLAHEAEAYDLLNQKDTRGYKYFNLLLNKFSWRGIEILVFPVLIPYSEAIQKATASRLVRWTFQLLLALQHLEHFGLIHNDLKPENIMFRHRIGYQFDVVVNDLSFCQVPNFSPAHGTPQFASPSKLQTGVAHTKEDMFSLGLTILNFIFGKQVIPGLSRRVAVGKYKNRFKLIEKRIFDWITPGYIQQLAFKDGSSLRLTPYISINDENLRNDFANFITRCLYLDESERMSVEEALGHPLFFRLNKNYI